MKIVSYNLNDDAVYVALWLCDATVYVCESGNKSSPNMCNRAVVVIVSLARLLFQVSPLILGDLWIINFNIHWLYWRLAHC